MISFLYLQRKKERSKQFIEGRSGFCSYNLVIKTNLVKSHISFITLVLDVVQTPQQKHKLVYLIVLVWGFVLVVGMMRKIGENKKT